MPMVVARVTQNQRHYARRVDLVVAQRTLSELGARGGTVDEWKAFRDQLTRTLLEMQGELVTAQRALLRNATPRNEIGTVAELTVEIQKLRSIKLEVDARLVELRAR